MPTAEKQLAFARRALGKARTDLALARLVLQGGPDMEPWVAAFHAQRAVKVINHYGDEILKVYQVQG